jgi:microcystin-dependent protein
VPRAQGQAELLRGLPTGPTFSANLYATGNPSAALNNAAIAPAGGGQRHENRVRSLALSYCICIDMNTGVYPSRN